MFFLRLGRSLRLAVHHELLVSASVAFFPQQTIVCSLSYFDCIAIALSKTSEGGDNFDIAEIGVIASEMLES